MLSRGGARGPKDGGRDAGQAERGQLPDGVLRRADGAEVARGAEAGVEVVLRDAVDAGMVEEFVEELEVLALGEARDVVLGRLEAALGEGPVLAEAARALRGVAGPADPGRALLVLGAVERPGHEMVQGQVPLAASVEAAVGVVPLLYILSCSLLGFAHE